MQIIIHDGDWSYFTPDQLYVATFTNQEFADLGEERYDVLREPTKLAEPVSGHLQGAPIEILTRMVKAWLPHAGVYEVNGQLQIATGMTADGGAVTDSASPERR